jgi:hypothetical protein
MIQTNLRPPCTDNAQAQVSLVGFHLEFFMAVFRDIADANNTDDLTVSITGR